MCCLPAKTSAFFFIHPARRALTAGLSAGFSAPLPLVAETVRYSEVPFVPFAMYFIRLAIGTFMAELPAVDEALNLPVGMG